MIANSEEKQFKMSFIDVFLLFSIAKHNLSNYQTIKFKNSRATGYRLEREETKFKRIV